MNSNDESHLSVPGQTPLDEVGVFSVPAPSDGAGIEKLTDNIARLETDLNSEREGRKEERFYWISAVAFLIDALVYNAMDSFPAFALLFLFQLIILIGIAQKLGVDWAVRGLGWLLHYIVTRGKDKDAD